MNYVGQRKVKMVVGEKGQKEMAMRYDADGKWDDKASNIHPPDAKGPKGLRTTVRKWTARV